MAPNPADAAAAQPPYSATHPPHLSHKKIAGIPFIAAIIIFIVVAAIVALIAWIVFTQLRARRLGLPAPTWRTYVPFVKNNKRSAPSSYEPARGAGNGFAGAVKGVFGAGNTGYSGTSTRSARTRKALDPDEAWDSRMVDDEDTSYNGGGYGQRTHDSRGRYGEAHQMQEHHGHEEPERGRSRSRDPPRQGVAPPYPVGGNATNPYAGDIRRPESEGFVGNNVKGGRPSVDSERRSVFRESIT